MTAGPTIAAFDFDATLTRSDCVVPYLRSVAGTARLVGGIAARSHRLVPVVVRRDRDRLKAFVSDVALRGVAGDDLDRHAAALAARIIADGLRDDTTARLEWHRRQGHTVVIVSASYEPYVRIVGDHLGVDEVLTTRLEIDQSGRCTGRLVGANCRGAEKARRLAEWLDSIGIDRRETTIWAYGDSSGDRAMLEFADHPVWATGRLGSVAATV